MNDLTVIVFCLIVIYLITSLKPWNARAWGFCFSMISVAILIWFVLDALSRILVARP